MGWLDTAAFDIGVTCLGTKKPPDAAITGARLIPSIPRSLVSATVDIVENFLPLLWK